MRIDIEQAIQHKFPAFSSKPALLRQPTLFTLRRLIHEREINQFLEENKEEVGFDFIDRVLDHFNFTYSVRHKEQMNIPATGRVLIVANHPLGALDGLALLKLIGEVRRDVRIIANDLLLNLDPLKSLLLPVDNMGGHTTKQDIKTIIKALQNNEAVIVFPSGEVSRASFMGVRDGRWNSGFLHFARKTNAPILPVYIGGKNSSLFYTLSSVNRNAATLLLPHEMFNKHDKTLKFRIGELIPFAQVDALPMSNKDKTRLLRKHLYRVSRNKAPLLRTERTIARPEDRQLLRQELRASRLLGTTQDGKKIYLFDYQPDSAVMAEIGRLREISFRAVGEGTGQRRDLDHYDRCYQHLVLWDDDDLEIAGAYRLRATHSLKLDDLEDDELKQQLYSSTLFEYHAEMAPYLARGVELGRSFVQPRYWGRRSLDYLWYGIGAYLRLYPEVKYLFGPVTLSNSYPKRARDLLVWFYSHYFPDTEYLGRSFNPYQLSDAHRREISALFTCTDYQQDFIRLREQLEFIGVSVPTLYKQYSDLCDPGGVRFLDFGVDADFGYCIDGLVLVEVDRIKARKRQRYIQKAAAISGD